MPTHDDISQFLREWAKLTPQQQTFLLAAVIGMVENLRAHALFRPSPRVKAVQWHPGVFGMTWAPNGRATFHYGAEVQPGEAHMIWRRIGDHDILRDP